MQCGKQAGVALRQDTGLGQIHVLRLAPPAIWVLGGGILGFDIAAEYALDHDMLSGILLWSSSLVAEVDQTITIALHIFISGFIALALVIALPEIIDGGFPEMRKTIASKLPNSIFTNRLSR
mgnify:CR=1 FL=1